MKEAETLNGFEVATITHWVAIRLFEWGKREGHYVPLLWSIGYNRGDVLEKLKRQYHYRLLQRMRDRGEVVLVRFELKPMLFRDVAGKADRRVEAK